MGQTREKKIEASKILTGKHLGKRTSTRPRTRWENNVTCRQSGSVGKYHFGETGDRIWEKPNVRPTNAGVRVHAITVQA